MSDVDPVAPTAGADADPAGGRSWWPWLAAVGSGALLAAAFPTWDVAATVWFWMFPLLAALWLPPPSGRLRAFAIGWVSGFVFHFLVLRWLRDIHGAGPFLSTLGWVILSAYLACFTGAWAVFASTAGRLCRAAILPAAGGDAPATTPSRKPGRLDLLVPGGRKPVGWVKAEAIWPSMRVIGFAAVNAAAWVFLEWARGWLLTGFGWNGLGAAMHGNPAMIQMAEITGAAGLSFLPVFVSICFFATIWRVHHRLAGGARRATWNLDFAAAMLMIVVWFLFGMSRLLATRAQGGPELEVAIIQRNIPQELKWQPDMAMEHTRGYLDAFAAMMARRAGEREAMVEQALADGEEVHLKLAGPEWIVMPESALPFYLSDPIVDEFRREILAMAGPQATLITGINDADPGEEVRYYNTIAVMAGDEEPRTYRKRNLVPFGEYLPLRWFPPMRWLAGAAVPGDFTAGQSTEPLVVGSRHGPIGILPAICFEDTLGRHTRLFARADGAQVLVNTTNDGWFKDPAAALQHAANAKLRCVELRRPMVRAANTGLSCVIDSHGITLGEIRDPATGSPQVADVLTVKVPLDTRPPLTFYARFGDVFSWACGLLAMAAVVRRCWRGRGQAVSR